MLATFYKSSFLQHNLVKTDSTITMMIILTGRIMNLHHTRHFPLKQHTKSQNNQFKAKQIQSNNQSIQTRIQWHDLPYLFLLDFLGKQTRSEMKTKLTGGGEEIGGPGVGLRDVEWSRWGVVVDHWRCQLVYHSWLIDVVKF